MTFAFHDGAELGSAMLSKIAKDTALKPEDVSRSSRIAPRLLSSAMTFDGNAVLLASKKSLLGIIQASGTADSGLPLRACDGVAAHDGRLLADAVLHGLREGVRHVWS